ncbi:hypothetical protein KPATCC21470_5755 [Kitasatospora purpeofusca]
MPPPRRCRRGTGGRPVRPSRGRRPDGTGRARPRVGAALPYPLGSCPAPRRAGGAAGAGPSRIGPCAGRRGRRVPPRTPAVGGAGAASHGASSPVRILLREG